MKIRIVGAELFHADWQTELKIASFFPSSKGARCGRDKLCTVETRRCRIIASELYV